MNTQVDKKIHDLRSYLGLSLKAFGEPIGYTGMHISRFEKGVLSPDERAIQKICQVFRVDPEYFSGDMPVDQAVQKVEVDTAGAGHRLSIARQEKGLSMLELSRRSGYLTTTDQYAGEWKIPAEKESGGEARSCA